MIRPQFDGGSVPATIFAYCERGRDASFWGEPLNAATNAAFIAAALYALWRQQRRPAADRTADGYLLIALLIAIGIGSFLFHTYATASMAMADVVPIMAFIVIYLIFALTRFVGMAPGLALVVTGAFVYGAQMLRGLRCDAPLAMRYDGAAGACFNGSISYVPALGALLVVGAYLRLRGHPAALSLLSAGGIFAVSLTLRTLDPALCSATEVGGYRIGTHFAWHLLNGVTLGILVLAAIAHWRHGLHYGEVLAPERKPGG